MRNTPSEPSLTLRDDNTLLEDLCLALRDVGVREYGLPNDERAIASIGKVKAIHSEVVKRGIGVNLRLAYLTEETAWLMEPLLADCLAYPSVVPYVREKKDGIRRALRCEWCGLSEFPDRQHIPLCDSCLLRALDVIAGKTPIEGFLLYRMYSPAYWCSHADEETVMMSFDNEYDPLGQVWCEQCIKEEQARRAET